MSQLVISPMASARVAALRSWPRTALVMVFEPGLRTPRMVMQRCSHSMTTITPTRLQDVVDGVGDLGGQSLLHLGSFGVDIDEASKLAEPGDLAL